MGDLRALAKSMRLMAKSVDKNAIEAVKSVANSVGVTVVYATPIDTSRARLNWQPSIGAPVTGTLLDYPNAPPSSQYGTTTAVAAIRSLVATYSGDPKGIFITNNLDYIQELNNGWSKQAPANFVALSVMAGINSAKSVKLLP